MTEGIATLSLETDSKTTRRRNQISPSARGMLREFLLGPENRLIASGIGLSDIDGTSPINFAMHPLLITAPAGYGKTQLLMALGATWSRHYAEHQVTFITGSELSHAYLEALKLDDVPPFQKRHCRADLLLIDRLDELVDSPAVQHQLSVILDHRIRYERPTVMTTRQPLHALKLSERLTSRISSGLIVPLELPAAATRRELLDRIGAMHRFELSDEARELLAENTLPIPQLLGLLNQINAMNAGACGPVEKQVVQQLLDDDHDQLDPRKIITATARHFGLKVNSVTGASRRKMDAMARAIAMFLIRDLTTLSYQQIGAFFQNRDHTTVMHAIRTVDRRRKEDSTFSDDVDRLESRVLQTEE